MKSFNRFRKPLMFGLLTGVLSLPCLLVTAVGNRSIFCLFREMHQKISLEIVNTVPAIVHAGKDSSDTSPRWAQGFIRTSQ